MHDINELVPHKGPMLLLDKVIESGEDHLISQVTIKENMLFCDEHGLPAYVGIELMAQTIAALAGLRAINKGEDIKIGMLLGSRNYHCEGTHFPLHSTVKISVKEVFFEQDGLAVFECRATGENTSAHCQLNVYQPQDIKDIIESIS